MMIIPLIGLTTKSDDLIEDFRIEFPSHVKDQGSNGFPCEVSYSPDDHHGNKVPVKIQLPLGLFPKESSISISHVL